jgi:hypothetical protein
MDSLEGKEKVIVFIAQTAFQTAGLVSIIRLSLTHPMMMIMRIIAMNHEDIPIGIEPISSGRRRVFKTNSGINLGRYFSK